MAATDSRVGFGRLVMPMADDMHTHLRQGKLMDLVIGRIHRGGW